MKIQLPRGAYAGRSSNVNAQVCQNLYPELDQEGGKSVLALYGTPGLVSRVVCEASAVVRGLYVFGDYLYAVVGSNLYQITDAWVATDIGNLDTSTGPVYFDDDGTYLGIGDRTSAYTYNPSTATFAEVTDTDLIGANGFCFMDGYWLTCYGQQFQKSTLLDPTDWAAADVANIRGRSDDLVTIYPFANYLWCIGEKTIELYYNTGNANFPFEKYPGGFYERGLISSGALCQTDDFLYILTDDREWIRFGADLQPTKISTPQIDFQICSCATVSDAVMFSYSQGGHTFIVLTFPTDSKTFVYDETTSLIHTRASYDSTSATDIRWRINCCEVFNGQVVGGGYADGTVYTLSMNVYVDDSDRIRRVAAFPSLHEPDSRRRLRINALEVEFEAGVGLTGGVQGGDPQAMLDYSKDGGHTWSNERWADIGKIGAYKNRARWRRLGIARDFIPRVAISDPVKIVIINAHADVEALR